MITTTETTTTARPPQVGEKAPDFKLILATGGMFQLSEATKKGPVIVAFFPGAFTGTCTKEMCSFTSSWNEYSKLGAQFVGVSVDSKHAQKAFIEKEKLGVPLASDFEKTTVRQWGVQWDSPWGVASKRATFIVDRSGVVRHANVQANASEEPNYAEIQAALAKVRT